MLFKLSLLLQKYSTPVMADDFTSVIDGYLPSNNLLRQIVL